MRKFFTCAALLLAVQCISDSRAVAQATHSELASQDFQPSDYETLSRRLAQLEAKQRLSGATNESHLYGIYESVIVAPVFSHNSAYYGQPGDFDGSAINVPFDYDLEYSPRIEVGYLAPTNQLGWRARYWHFNSSARAGNHTDVFGVDPVDDAIAIGVGVTIEDIDSFDAGTILHSMNLNVGDLEVTHQFRNVVLGAGMRISEIRQRYQFVDVNTDEGDELDARMRTLGLGPTVSLQWEQCLWRSRWSLFSDTRLSTLFGRHDINAVGEGTDIEVFQYSATKPILGGDIQAGLQYRRNRFFGRIGVEAQHWSNVGNAMNTISHGEDENGDNGMLFNGDLGFIGLTAGLGFQF